MRTGSQQRHAPRWVLGFLAAMVAALAAILLGTTASASAAGGPETRVGAISVTVEPLVGPPHHITAGQSRDATLQHPGIVVATSVAANGGVRSAFDIGPKATRAINGRTRILDGLNDVAVSEVKNVQRLSYTRQLRDYADYASQNGLRLDIYVRGGTNISGPLARADLDPMSPVNIIRYLE